MNKIFKLDYFLFFFVISLLIFGIISLWSSSCKNIFLINKTIFHIILGFFFIIILYKIDYKIYKKYSYYIYIFVLFLLVFVYFFGNVNKGSCRWIKILNFKFQPSELTKISVSIMISKLIDDYGCPNSIKLVTIYIIIILIPSFLVFIQPDLGTSVIIFISGLSILFISGIKNDKSIYIFFLILIISIFSWFFIMKDYQKNRIYVFLNKNTNPYGLSYHINQSKIAIGSGGLLGKGLFKGTQSRLKFIPESHTDFIFSVIAEEFGLIGIFILFFFYFGLIFRIFFIAINSNNIFSRLLISSFMLTIFFNILINIGMVIGFLPVVGVPLPFISYGGSSLVTIFIKLGIINSINCNKNDYKIF